MATQPTSEQIKEFLALDLEGEIVMLNLLKFKAAAAGGGSGAAEYARYAERVRKLVEGQGGRLVWVGKPRHTLIGDPAADDYDAVALVAYPSREAFIQMTASDSYKDAHKHREGGLERQALICMQADAAFD